MSLPEITDVQRYRLQPGDALVLRVAGRISPVQAERVKEQVRAGLGILGEDVPVLVLDESASLSVASSAGIASTGPPAACEGRVTAGGPVLTPADPARETAGRH